GERMRRECFFSAVSEDELNEVLEGKELVGEPLPNPWSWRSLEFHAAGVIWRRLEAISGTQPLVIIVRPDDMRRLYGRFAQLRSHLSPISAWCYVVTPQQFASLDDLVAIPDLGELAAAWTGLVISEAQ